MAKQYTFTVLPNLTKAQVYTLVAVFGADWHKAKEPYLSAMIQHVINPPEGDQPIDLTNNKETK